MGGRRVAERRIITLWRILAFLHHQVLAGLEDSLRIYIYWI
jgi:hypothetical protein